MLLTLATVAALLLSFENGRKTTRNTKRIHHMSNRIDDVIAQFDSATSAVGARLDKLASDLAASQAATAAAIASDATDQAKLAAALANAATPEQVAELQSLAAHLAAMGSDGSAPAPTPAPVTPTQPDPTPAPSTVVTADGSSTGGATV